MNELVKRLRDIADGYPDTNKRLNKVATDIATYGEMSKEERMELAWIADDLRYQAVDIEELLQGVI